MATIFQVFDLREAALAEGKQQSRERRYLDGGFEAPRNSLDVANLEAADDSRSSIFRSDDIPIGYEYHNPAVVASIRRLKKDSTSHSLPQGSSPSRKRAPSVVARLMGLETLPDELPTRKFSQPGTPTYGSSKPGLIRQRSQGAVPSSWQRPPLPRRAPAHVEEERVLAPVLSFRDHPQETQLQKFKLEFEAKQQATLAKKQEQLRTLQLDDMNRELEEKKEKVRATLDKAKTALALAEAKRAHSDQGQFEESKEFLDAMKFLQSNKDFIFQFLQPKSESNENSNAPTPITLLRKGKGNATLNIRKRDGFSPRAFARLLINPRKWNDSKQQSDPVPQLTALTVERCNSSGSRQAPLDDVKQKVSSSKNSKSDLRTPPSPKVQRKRPPRDEANKTSARDVIVKIKERLLQREQCDRIVEPEEETVARLRDFNDKDDRRSSQKNDFTRMKYLSTGKRVSMHTEDIDDVTYTSDGEDISTPLVTIVRENARRSSVSLPSSPHLSARSPDGTTIIRRRATAKAGISPPPESKKTTLTSGSPQRRGSQAARGPLLSSTEVERSLRKSASVSESASRTEALEHRIEASEARCQNQSTEPALNLTRCRSIPNVAVLRGQCSVEAVQAGVRQFNENIAKSTNKTAKQAMGPKPQRTKGFFSGGRKKAGDGSQAITPAAQHLFSSSTPVLARFAALAESCVSRSTTLSDADSAVNVRLHTRTRRNARSPKVPLLPFTKETHEVESVVSESSAESDAGSCDEFLEALSQLRPLAKLEHLIPQQALPSTASSQQQIQRNLKPTAPKKVEDEQESNSDNNSQPSPVSVLDAPFEEKLPVLKFKEIANSHQGLQKQLHLLKVERTKEVPSELVADKSKVQTTILEDRPSNRQHFAYEGPSTLAHISRIMIGSDFITHGGRLISKWHSATKPINPHLFHDLEVSYYAASDAKRSGERRLVFDSVNEILAEKLRPHHVEPWTNLHIQSNMIILTGKRLVEDVWNEVQKRQFPDCGFGDDYLESLVAHDLQTSPPWMALHHDVNNICLHLERAILDDLILEVCRL